MNDETSSFLIIFGGLALFLIGFVWATTPSPTIITSGVVTDKIQNNGVFYIVIDRETTYRTEVAIYGILAIGDEVTFLVGEPILPNATHSPYMLEVISYGG